MLYLKNSKGKEAFGLIEDIFQGDLANRSSTLHRFLKVLREGAPQLVHCEGNGSVFLELLVAAEGMPFTSKSSHEEETQSLLEKHLVKDLRRKTKEPSHFFVICTQVSQVHSLLYSPKEVQTILLLDVSYDRKEWKSCRVQLASKGFEVKESYHFSFFTRFRDRGKVGRFFGKLDQSFIQHFIPITFKRSIYIHITHG